MFPSTMLMKPDQYYTQRNNDIHWLRACMWTSRSMWYIGNRIGVNNSTNYPMDDFLGRELESKEAISFCHTKYPWSTNRKDKNGKPLPDIPPGEVHGMYGSWLDEKVTGKRRSDFRTDLTWRDYLQLITIDRVVVMTAGSFPTTTGHAVVFSGYDADSEALIIEDPYGNYHTNYQDVHGHGIRMLRDDFEDIIHTGDSSKVHSHWGHVPFGWERKIQTGEILTP